MFFLLLLGLSRSRRPVSFAALPLDFITHYDIKYRMGQDAGEADEG